MVTSMYIPGFFFKDATATEGTVVFVLYTFISTRIFLSFWVGMSPEDAPLASNSRGETNGTEGSRRAVQPRGDRMQPDSTLKPLRSNQVGTGARHSNADGGSWIVTGLD